jgi:hypothetical protein
MAHVGKDYKLWFRRDANVFLDNYRRGFPEAFRVESLGPMFSARWAISLLKDVLWTNTSKEFSPTWTSVPVGGVFDNVFASVTLPIEPTLRTSVIDLRFDHKALINTPIFHAEYFMSILTEPYRAFSTASLKQLFYLSPDITLNPDNFAMYLRAADWSQYNP